MSNSRGTPAKTSSETSRVRTGCGVGSSPYGRWSKETSARLHSSLGEERRPLARGRETPWNQVVRSLRERLTRTKPCLGCRTSPCSRGGSSAFIQSDLSPTVSSRKAGSTTRSLVFLFLDFEQNCTRNARPLVRCDSLRLLATATTKETSTTTVTARSQAAV